MPAPGSGPRQPPFGGRGHACAVWGQTRAGRRSHAAKPSVSSNESDCISAVPVPQSARRIGSRGRRSTVGSAANAPLLGRDPGSCAASGAAMSPADGGAGGRTVSAATVVARARGPQPLSARMRKRAAGSAAITAWRSAGPARRRAPDVGLVAHGRWRRRLRGPDRHHGPAPRSRPAEDGGLIAAAPFRAAIRPVISGSVVSSPARRRMELDFMSGPFTSPHGAASRGVQRRFSRRAGAGLAAGAVPGLGGRVAAYRAGSWSDRAIGDPARSRWRRRHFAGATIEADRRASPLALGQARHRRSSRLDEDAAGGLGEVPRSQERVRPMGGSPAASTAPPTRRGEVRRPILEPIPARARTTGENRIGALGHGRGVARGLPAWMAPTMGRAGNVCGIEPERPPVERVDSSTGTVAGSEFIVGSVRS